MNRMTRLILAAAVSGVVALPVTMRAQVGPDVNLRKAIELETMKGDLRGAIELYKKVADGRDRAAAATALLRMAESYQKLGDSESKRAYERLVREFGDQKEAAVARARLGSPAEPSVARGDRAVWTGRDVDLFGTVSHDGRYLTYIDWARTQNLMVRDLIANTARPLTNVKLSEREGADWSTISRDGAQVAYRWWLPGGQQYEVRVAPLSGSGVPTPRTVWRGAGRESIRPFDWSPDGRRLVVLVEREDKTSQLALLSVADGSLQIHRSFNWRGVNKALFSHDGRFIAYDLRAGDGSPHSSVHIMAVDASRDTPAMVEASQNKFMGWSPDGRHLLFASDRTGALALWALRVNGGVPDGAPTMVKRDLPSSLSLGVAKTGALYIWKHASAHVVKVVPLDLESGAVDVSRPIFQRFIESRGRPHWSDDGKDLLFISCGASGGGPCPISIRSAETGTVRDVRHTLGYVQTPRLSPDRRLIATNGTDFNGRRGVYLIDPNANKTTLLVAADETNQLFLDWTLDSTAILYATRRDRMLIQRDVRSGAETALMKLPSECSGPPQISPDRKLLGCLTADASGQPNALLVTPLDGGPSRVAFKASPGEEFDGIWFWAPDSRGAVVAKPSAVSVAGDLWLMPFTGTPRRLNIDTANWVDPFSHISPDGREFAFTASTGAPGDEVWALENFLPAETVKR